MSLLKKLFKDMRKNKELKKIKLMPKKYMTSPEDAVLALDESFASKNFSNICKSIYGTEDSYEVAVLKRNIERMGYRIYFRKKCVFIEKQSENGLDSEVIILSRKAKMFDGVECREKFQVRYTKKLGWLVVKRSSIEIKKELPNFGTITYDGYSWEFHNYVPCLNCGVKFSLNADQVFDERGPGSNQLDTVKKILDYKISLRSQLADKTFQFTKDSLENWLGDWDELSERELIDVMDFTFVKPENSIQSLQTIRPPFLVWIGEDVDPASHVTFAFYVETKCDEEHGLAFLIKNWKITECAEHGSI